MDIVLLVLIVVFGISGYRQGFIIGALSFVGFIGGGILGAIYTPQLARQITDGHTQQVLLAIVMVFVCATLGQFISSSLGAVLRDRVTWHPARYLDAAGGAVVSVLSLLLIAWFVGTAIAHSPFPRLSYQVRNSQVLRTTDQLMPEVARTWFSQFRQLVDKQDFPQVFGNLGPERIVEVPPPDTSVLNTPELRQARKSTVKIVGAAPQCQRRIEGSGFVYAPQHIMTNAHVVAGVRGGPSVVVRDDKVMDSRVVLFDPNRDIAVLYVPGLEVPPLDFDYTANSGDSAVVAGYPRNNGFTAAAARIRGEQRARGPNIYHTQQITRQIYALRAQVEPGNSGGPLLSPDGEVYGVVFAAAVNDPDTGYALTAQEVRADARKARNDTEPVYTHTCD